MFFCTFLLNIELIKCLSYCAASKNQYYVKVLQPNRQTNEAEIHTFVGSIRSTWTQQKKEEVWLSNS